MTPSDHHPTIPHVPPNLLDLLKLKRHVEKSGISLNQLCVLVSVEHQAKTHQQIAEDLAITPAAMTSQIDSLAAKSLIVSMPDTKDRRKRRVTLTDHGRQTLQNAASFNAVLKTQTPLPTAAAA